MTVSNTPKIIYQDKALIILEKPAGMPSLPVKPSVADPNTVEGWLIEKFPKARLVHRLDNETSGLMVAALTDAIYKNLRALWKTADVVKKYTALVLGKTPSHGEITTPIAHHPKKKKKMMVGGDKAKPAHTKFKTIGYHKDCSLIEVEITTGVRHQIRVHLASIGHPILGDKIYQKASQLPRHFLHLSNLKFPHPLTNKKMEWHSELPDSFLKF